MQFSGIPYAMDEFFIQIAFNNNAEFFNDNRKAYERDVKQPLYALAEALAPTLTSIDGELDTRPSRVVSRIRRDTRFSRDKSPYRDHMWLGWRKVRAPGGERDRNEPSIYVGIERAGWSVGTGYYQATPAMMRAFRARLAASPASFLRLIEDPDFAQTYSLRGEDYKRPAAGIERIPQALRPWYNKKSFYVEYGAPLDEGAREASFVDALDHLIRILGPLYRDLCALPVG